MSFKHLIAGRQHVARIAKSFADLNKDTATIMAVGALVALVLMDVPPSRAADGFPFDRELLLEAAPMRPAKRVPVLTVAPNGSARIDLWCRTVNARVELSDGAVRVEPGPLPDGLPQYMSQGQCTPQRMQADEETLAALAQVTGWRRWNDGVELNGPQTMRFRLSSH
jgi:hypothetical protein